MNALTPTERAKLTRMGLIIGPAAVLAADPLPPPVATFASTPGPRQGQSYRSPYTKKRGRVAVLQMVEAELRAKLKDIEARPNWRASDKFSAAHFAYTQAIQIVRDHHVISADGRPMRGHG